MNDYRGPLSLDFVQHRQLSYHVPFEVDWQTQGASPMIEGGTRAIDLETTPVDLPPEMVVSPICIAYQYYIFTRPRPGP